MATVSILERMRNAVNENPIDLEPLVTQRGRFGLGVDTAFDAIGSEQTALQAIDAVAPGGRAVLVGIPAFSTRAPINPSQIVRERRSAHGWG